MNNKAKIIYNFFDVEEDYLKSNDDNLEKLIEDISIKMNEEVPKWMIEGIKGYLLGVKEKSVTVDIPTPEDLESMDDCRFYSYLYIKYIIDTYGKTFLLEYLRTLDDVDVFGTTINTISNMLAFELEKRG